MCGIVGYIGKKNAIPILINGLKKLEYRGYDSAGIAYHTEKDISIIKNVGRIKDLENLIDSSTSSHVGIGHTRWATHGSVNLTNSHPHQVNDITLVHNGIIENYLELKELLLKKGYTFQSETDTEVVCAYIDYLRKTNPSWNITKVLTECMNHLTGSFALVILLKQNKEQLFVMKKDSPLVIGIGKEEYFIASDPLAYLTETNQYIMLEDQEIGIIEKDHIQILKDDIPVSYQIKTINQKNANVDKGNYEHYMLKEIHEQVSLIKTWNQHYFNTKEKLLDISQYHKIQIVGCGTAYHAGLIGKYLLEPYTHNEINVYVASEYRYQTPFIDKNTLVIVISQSGETADTLSCVKLAKKHLATTLGIINVQDSSIARTTDYVIYTNAGPEIAVASTKAYTSQIYILSLLAKQLSPYLEEEITSLYQKLPTQIEELINWDYSSIVEHISTKEHLFYLGRNIDYATVLEGSLKLKEITYLHSEAFPAGELKHGPISLIEEKTPVIALISHQKTASKTISNIKEVKSRGAYVILIIQKDILTSIDPNCYDEIIWIPSTISLIQPILNIIPLQMIAYLTAKKKNLDIDKPRNLAKSVTVE